MEVFHFSYLKGGEVICVNTLAPCSKFLISSSDFCIAFAWLLLSAIPIASAGDSLKQELKATQLSKRSGHLLAGVSGFSPESSSPFLLTSRSQQKIFLSPLSNTAATSVSTPIHSWAEYDERRARRAALALLERDILA